MFRIFNMLQRFSTSYWKSFIQKNHIWSFWVIKIILKILQNQAFWEDYHYSASSISLINRNNLGGTVIARWTEFNQKELITDPIFM